MSPDLRFPALPAEQQNERLIIESMDRCGIAPEDLPTDDRTTVSVSVVVCAFSLARLDQTRHCLQSVLGGNRQPDELLLVVDNNEELRQRFVDEFGDRVIVLANEGRGLSEGRNTGVHHATSEVIAFIDDDAWPDDEWLYQLLGVFDDEAVLGAGGRVEPDWEEPRVALPPELHWIVGSTYRGHREDRGPITRPIGANMAARRAVLLSLGGFSPAFGRRAGMKESSNEELALFALLAARYGPGHIWYEPRAVVHHFAPAARCSLSYLWKRAVIEGASKADVKDLFGPGVMAHDRSYVTATVLPGVVAHLGRAVSRRDIPAARHAAMLLGTLLVTSASYCNRLAATRAGALVDRRAFVRGGAGPTHPVLGDEALASTGVVRR